VDIDGGDTLQYHRPHAFALMHGGGTKIAFGKLFWRLDVLLAAKEPSAPGADIHDLSQSREIAGFKAVTPTLNSPSGKELDPEIPNTYHPLGKANGYGDVYLYWKVEPEEEEIVTECYVSMDDLEDDLQNLQGAGTGRVDHLLTNPGAANLPPPTPLLNIYGFYRVKIGAVNENELITQNITSDVFWSALLLEKDAEGFDDDKDGEL
jgi:hypothetical protein